MWREAVRLAGDALPIDVARHTHVDQLGLMGFAAMTAPTLFDALRTAIRYHALVTDDGRWTLEQRGPFVVGRWIIPGGRDPGRCASTTAMIAHFVECTRQVAGRPVAFERVGLCESAGAAAEELFDCAVDADLDAGTFVVRRDTLEGRTRADPALAGRAKIPGWVSERGMTARPPARSSSPLVAAEPPPGDP